MKKTIISIMYILILLLVPTMVFATEEYEAKIGTETFSTLEEAITKAGENDEIQLSSNVELESTVAVNKDVTINLNGFTISGASPVFEIKGAEFNVKGNGTIKENSPYYAPIYVRGSEDSTAQNYSVVNIGTGVILEGWSGIMIKEPDDSNTHKYTYGVVINCEGVTINSVKDTSGGTGHGVYIDGDIINQDNCTIINLTSVEINSEGTGIYAAGYAKWNITDSTIEGNEIGLGIKSGIIELNNVTANGYDEFSYPTGNGNGITSTGAAIQIEEYKNYAGKIDLTINGGNYTSKNNSALLEYTTSGEEAVTFIEKIQINGGTFTSAEGIDVIVVSDSFKETITNGFITGGTFSSDVSTFIPEYHVCEKSDAGYVVNKLHDITVKYSDGGTASSDFIRAIVGKKVGLYINVNEGYELAEIIITDELGNQVKTTNEYFTMPDSPVTVEVVFSKLKQEVVVPDAIEDAGKVEEIVLESLKGNKEFEELIKNNNVEVKVEFTENKVDENRKEEIEKSLKEDVKVAKYIDITIAIKNKDTGDTVDTLDELNETIKFTVVIPEDLPEVADGFTRKYYMIRNHDGVIEYLDVVLSEDGKSLSFATDKFSAYALAYTDVENSAEDEGNKEPEKEPEKQPGGGSENTESQNPTEQPTETPNGALTGEAKGEEEQVEEEKTNPNIPNTGDNIVLYVLLAISAMIGIISLKKINTKKSKH